MLDMAEEKALAGLVSTTGVIFRLLILESVAPFSASSLSGPTSATQGSRKPRPTVHDSGQVPCQS